MESFKNMCINSIVGIILQFCISQLCFSEKLDDDLNMEHSLNTLKERASITSLKSVIALVWTTKPIKNLDKFSRILPIQHAAIVVESTRPVFV